MQKTELTKARFWTYYKGSVVRLTVEEGKELVLSSGGPTDEGYSYTTDTFWVRDGYLHNRVERSSCDCDGPLYSTNNYRAALTELNDSWNDYVQVYYPSWERMCGWQRDVYAEKMGY